MQNEKPYTMSIYCENELSQKQLNKGIQRGELTFAAIICDEDSSTFEKIYEVPIPSRIAKVLEEFEDIMPKDLPKRLPLRWEVDHVIELVDGVKPISQPPYDMSPEEFEKLRSWSHQRVHTEHLFSFKKRRIESCMCNNYQAPTNKR
jgi:hypothetical protein